MLKLAILMYHSIISPNNDPDLFSTEDPIYTIKAEMFEKQIQYLYEHNFPVLTLDDIFQKINLRNDQTIIILTFDDGHISNYTTAFPILKKYRFKAHFFITTGWINKPNYMTEKMIKELSNYGMAIGSHTITHRFLTKLSKSEIIKELRESKKLLEKITLKEVKYLSIPGGRVNKKILKLAKDVGYKSVFTSHIGFNSLKLNTFLNLKRIPIKQNITFEQFKKILNGKISKKYIVKTYLFDVSKKILGDSLYGDFRKIVLDLFSLNKKI